MSTEAGGKESRLQRMTEKMHEYKDDAIASSSSDSDTDKDGKNSKDSKEDTLAPTTIVKKKHLFGRTEPVHAFLGGGKPADIILWRNKQTTASIVASGTVIWILFECMGYHLLTLLCRSLVVALAVIFLWSNASSFLNKAPPKIPEVMLPEAMFLDIAQTLRFQINEAFATLQIVASGKDLKQFLMVIAGLWGLSVVGGWFNFLTLFFIVFVIVYTVPVLYEKYEDDVDAAAEIALIEINKHYEVLDAKFLHKIPKVNFMSKKQQ